MAGSSITLEGLQELKRNLNATSREMTDALGAAIYEIVNEIARESSRLVPVDTGNLRSSRTVEFRKVNGGRGIEAEIAYGGTAAGYALIQHERLDLWHPPKPPGKSKVGKRSGTGPVEPGQGRGPKYLEFPFNELMQRQPQDLADRMSRRVTFRRGVR